MISDWCESKGVALLRYACFFPLVFITQICGAQVKKPALGRGILTNASPLAASRATDTLNGVQRPVTDTGKLATVKINDSTLYITDTLSLNVSKDSLDAPVRYQATDSGVLNLVTKQFVLYGQANTVYKTIDLSAGTIELDNEQNLVKAYFVKDSNGVVKDRPKLKEGDMESEADTMFYNTKTQRGLTKNTYTKQGEMFVYAERIKKQSGSSYFASLGRFTTCNLDTPHFAFRARRMKLVNNKWAYSGVVYPEFESVPLPVGLPFGIFPLSQGRHSGFLAPSFATTENFGLGLEGLGYYKVLSEQIDMVLRANVYSYGGFNISAAPTYRKRYKYNGAVRMNYQNTRINFKGDPDFSKIQSYSFGWNHSMDSKARPGTTFAANVNFGSPNYNSLVPNNNRLNFVNQVTSSVQYSKSWGQGAYNLSVTGNHSQNNQTGQFNVSLPNVTFTANTFYPLASKADNVLKARWYEKLGIGYNGQVQNQFSFFNSDSPYNKMDIGQIIDTLQWGAQHNIPITLSLPQLGPFQIAPGISYQERWYGQQVRRIWNDRLNKVDTNLSKGFYTGREMSLSLSIATAIFGTANFKKGNLRAIRHVVRPTVGISYKPDLAGKDYYEVQVDTVGNTYRFSYYDGSILTAFSEGRFGGMNFGLQNNLEIKVRDRSDTSAGANKKIKLLDNLAINSAYNFIVDSFRLSPISILASTTLFEKMNITASTVLDPCQTDSRGRRIDRYMWQDGGRKIGRFTSGSLSFGTSFQSKSKTESKKNPDEALPEDQFVTPEEQQQQLAYIRNNPAEFADFNIPWTLNISYSLNFTRDIRPDYSGYYTRTFSSLNLQGDFNFAPKWKLGGTSFYDFNTKKIANLSMFVSREMHCWQMAIKSGLLRDLKINRTRTFYQ
jgi:LPS-assembly protein